MNNLPQNVLTTAPTTKQKPDYKPIEKAFAVICLIFGYLFIKYILCFSGNVIAPIYFITFSISSLVFYKYSGISTDWKSTLFFVFITLFSLHFILFDNAFLLFLTAVFIIFMIIYWNYYISKKPDQIISNHFILDMLNATFVLPFASYIEAPAAIASIYQKKKGGKLKLILLGLVIALPITIIIGNLLLSADRLFDNMMSHIFQDINKGIMEFIFYIIAGVPVALYLFGMLFSNARQKHNHYIKENADEKITTSLRIMPATILYTAVTPICVLYALFFLSQAGYFLSAFQSYLPSGFSYAEYARRGFFELCAVAILNFIILILLNGLCKWQTELKPVGLKIYTIILSIFTLMLIATAMSKMVLYMNTYGFTQLRIYVSWFMLLLGAIFFIILCKTIFQKVNVVKSSVITFIIFFAILSFSNIDGMVAKYNVKWYQSGKVNEMDISMLYDLSDAAIPYVIPLVNDENQTIANETKEYLTMFADRYEHQTWKDWNLASYRAYQEYVKAMK